MKQTGALLLLLLLNMALVSSSFADETPYNPNNESNSQEQKAIQQEKATQTALSALNQCQLKSNDSSHKLSFLNGG